MKLTRSQLFFWYKIYEIQATEEEIGHEYLSKPKGKLPSPEIMRKLVDDRIKERKEKAKQRVKYWLRDLHQNLF